MIVVLTSYNAIQSTEQESLIASLCMIMWQTETVSYSLIMKVKQLT